MKTIIPGNKRIGNLVTASVKPVEFYKRSSFILTSECKDGYLTCNTLTGELMLLTSEEERILCDFEHISKKLPIPIEFFQHGLLVPLDCDEVKRTEQLRSIIQRVDGGSGRINHYNILPTTSCNARCFYCYESGVKHITMTQEIADQLISFICVHRNETRPVVLSWFGGEPTLGRMWIDYICERLTSLRIPFYSEMISNGYLYDVDLVQHAKELWKLQGIQITLDGTEDVYNKTKSFVGVSDNPYLRVLRNIELLLDVGIRVDIRLNMDDHNSVNLNNLVEELEERFRGQKNLIVYVRLLKENVGFQPVRHTDDGIIHLREQYMKLRQRLEEDGWPQTKNTGLPQLRVFHCMADNPGIVQITPDGMLGKCEDSIFDHIVGTLKDGISDMKEIQRWKETDYYDECSICPLLPSCMNLLAHCPPRLKGCPVDEKEEMEKKFKTIMITSYEHWKTNEESRLTEKAEGDNGFSDSNC